MSNPVSFALVGIKTEQFAILSEKIDRMDKETELQTSFRFATNPEQKMLGVFCRVQFFNKKHPVLILEVSCHFKLDDTSWLSLLSDNQKEIIISKDFATHLLVLSIGTIRGVLHAKTENTNLSHLILPTMDLSDFITEDVKVTLLHD